MCIQKPEAKDSISYCSRNRIKTIKVIKVLRFKCATVAGIAKEIEITDENIFC